jgi:hypothetical protein
VPEQWIREVMRQESDGQEQVVSSAGAMGLMQIMPDTFDELRQRYALGGDPFEPHDNIMAGAAYIREMYDRYGAPGFLAAYNAGPYRLEGYLGGGDSLPDETINYVASIAPRLGGSVPMTGPLAVYAQGGNVARDPAVPVGQVAAPVAMASRAVDACDQDAAYDPDRPCAPAPTLTATAPVVVMTASGCDSDAAYDPSRVARDGCSTFPRPLRRGPRSFITQRLSPASAAAAPAALIERQAAALGRSRLAHSAISTGSRNRQRRSRRTGRFTHHCSDRGSADSPFGACWYARLGNLSAMQQRCLRQTGGQPAALHRCCSRANASRSALRHRPSPSSAARRALTLSHDSFEPGESTGITVRSRTPCPHLYR